MLGTVVDEFPSVIADEKIFLFVCLFLRYDSLTSVSLISTDKMPGNHSLDVLWPDICYLASRPTEVILWFRLEVTAKTFLYAGENRIIVRSIKMVYIHEFMQDKWQNKVKV